MKYIKQLSTLTATGLAAVLATGVTGCTQQTQEQAQAKGAFVIIEETAIGKYKIVDEFPADETRIVLKKLDGSENVLTQAHHDKYGWRYAWFMDRKQTFWKPKLPKQQKSRIQICFNLLQI